jgi:sarcosine oxidase, subunit beta
MTSEVMIVGAGVYGCALAWNLARRNVQVTLLEADTVASGASGGPGHRGVRASGRMPYELPIASRSLQLWQRLADDLGHETGFRRLGSLRVYEAQTNANVGGWASAAHSVAIQEAFGLRSELVPGERIPELEPALERPLLGAVVCPDDGTADHTKTTIALCSAARELGAKLREHTAVVQLQVRHGRVQEVVLSDGSALPVPGLLVLLANTGVPELVEAATGLSLPIWSIQPQMTFARPHEPVSLKHLLSHDSRRLAMKQLPTGEVMISGGWTGITTASGLSVEELPHTARVNYDDAAAVLPALRGGSVVDLDATRFETVSLDARPVIDAIPGLDNALMGTGWTGHGFAVSLGTAELLADWVLDGKRPEPLAPYSADRFIASRRLEGAPA